MEAAHATNRVRSIRIKRKCAIFILFDERSGQKWRKHVTCSNCAAPWPSATMWRSEGLVQIVMHHINAEVARSCNTHQCVEVCAVSINEPAFLMDNFANIYDLAFEDAER